MSSNAITIPGAQIQARPWVDELHQWVTTVDHKRLGILYVLSALLFLVIGGVEALIIRIQLMHSHNNFVSPEVFNRMFTMHGTTMIFFVAMPVLFGFANYLVPLMIGARDMAFPRLNAFSFWLSFLGGLLLYFSLSEEAACTAQEAHRMWVGGLMHPWARGPSRRVIVRTIGLYRCWFPGLEASERPSTSSPRLFACDAQA